MQSSEKYPCDVWLSLACWMQVMQCCNEDSSKIYVEGSVIDLMYIGIELFFVKGEE